MGRTSTLDGALANCVDGLRMSIRQMCTPLPSSTPSEVPTKVKASPNLKRDVPYNACHLLRVVRTILDTFRDELRIPLVKQSKANQHRKLKVYQKMTRKMSIRTRLAPVCIVFIMVHVISVMCANHH